MPRHRNHAVRPGLAVNVDPRRWGDDVTAVAAEIDVRTRYLPRTLLRLPRGWVVGVEPTGRRPDKPAPRVGQTGRPGSLERLVPAAARVHVDVDDEHARRAAGRQADVGVRGTPPPALIARGEAVASWNPFVVSGCLPRGTHGKTGIPRPAYRIAADARSAPAEIVRIVAVDHRAFA